MSQSKTTPFPIRFIRCLRLLLLFVWIGMGTAVVYPFVDEKWRASLKKRWSHQILNILSVRLDAQPTDAPTGCLIVANHISWLDIFAINAFRPVAFVSKSDIRQWPFFGWLAERNQTVFLRRGSRGHAREVNGQIDALLNNNTDVGVFPEGTTTDGTHLLGFHAALLQPAIETGRLLLPLAVSYHDSCGNISRAPSFAGETTLMQCISAILRCRTLTVRLLPAPAIGSAGKTRRELSQQAHAAIAATLVTRPGFHPSSSPPEKSSGPQAG